MAEETPRTKGGLVMAEETPRYVFARFGDNYGILDTAIPDDVQDAPRFADFGVYDENDDLSDECARLNTGASSRGVFGWRDPSELGDRFIAPTLPTEPGVYLDVAGDPWYAGWTANYGGMLTWRYMGSTYSESGMAPEDFLPFTRAKVVAE